MGHVAHHLLLHQFLDCLRVACQIVQLFLCSVFLCQFNLLPESLCDCVFELGLYRLACPEHISKFARERFVNGFFYSCLWLILVLGF